MVQRAPIDVRAHYQTVSDDNPWPGLLAYNEADKKYFHGRRAESDQLFRLVMREPLTVMFGLSGLGKSSLIQAGLFPLLRQGRVLPVYIRLDFSPGHPDLASQTLAAISAAAVSGEAEAPAGEKDQTLWAYFHRKEADFWSRQNRLLMPLLVFDQFEELFTLGMADSARADACEQFVHQLGDLIEGRPPADLKKQLDLHPENAGAYAFSRHHYKVLISLREDFLADLEGFRQVIPSIFRNRMRLHRMNGRAALEVVAHARHLIDPSVAEQVVRFVAAKAPDTALEKIELEPALLSVLCRELNIRRRKRGEPRITHDQFRGSQEEILRGFYERSLQDLGPEIRDLVEEKLLTVSGFRDSMALENALTIEGVTRIDIDRLVDRRLVRKENSAGVQRIELTHDVLTRVIADSRKERRERENERTREAALEKYQIKIREQERVQRLEDRAKSARRLLLLLIAAVVMCIMAVSMGTLAFFQRNLAMDQNLKAKRSANMAEIAKGEAVKQQILAKKEADNAVKARAEAEEQRDLAGRRLERITDGIALRQAVLSGNIDTTRWSKYIHSEITFLAKATPMGFKTGSGKDVYKFEVFPDVTSVPGGFDAIAFITYRMDHPTFRNTLLTTGPDRRFRASYDGWGCLNQVYALVEYDDVEKDPSLVDFNMCRLLGW